MKSVLTFILILIVTVLSIAQSDSTRFQIKLKDGNSFIGYIISQDQTKIVLKTKRLGEIAIPKLDIRSIDEIKNDEQVRNQYMINNPQAARYFWQPNGYGLSKGEGYYQNILGLFNQASIGLTNNFSVGIGVVPLFHFSGAPTPVWITPKISLPVKKDKFNVGVGVLAGSVIGVEKYDYYNGGSSRTNQNFGIAYGVMTFGSRFKNLSLGLGYGYSNGRWASRPSVSLSFMVHTGGRSYLLSENYIINNLGLITMGVRTFFNRVSIDYGCFTPVGASIDRFVAMPWFGLVVPFGKKTK